MRLHGILTIVALLLIAGGALPMLMGETMSLTGEHDGAMFGELLFTVGTDPYYVGDFKHTNIHESSLQLYGVMGGVEIPVTLDDIDYENGRYALNYLLSLDNNQVLNLDGTFEDGVFTDLSGNGNHGTPYNGATTGTGVVGDGMSFDGTNDYVNCGNDTSLNFTGEGTWSIWFKSDVIIDNTLANHTYLYFKYGSNKGFFISFRAGLGNLAFYLGNGDSLASLYSSTSSWGGTDWYNIVVTNSISDGRSIYVNGTLENNGPFVDFVNSESQSLIINYTNKFDGNLDEIRIYDRELTADEVSYLNDCVDVSNIEYPYGTEIYASYTYSDTFAPIGSDLFGLGVSLVGCVMLIVVVVGSTGRW